MRLLINKGGDLVSYFDKINEREAGILDSSFKQTPIKNDDVETNKSQNTGHLPIEHFPGF